MLLKAHVKKPLHLGQLADQRSNVLNADRQYMSVAVHDGGRKGR